MEKYKLYKESCIEWIGAIPTHWEICKLKNVSTIVLGKMLMDKRPEKNDADYTLEYYLKSKNIGWLKVFNEIDDVEKMWFSSSEKKQYLLKDNDIVMNEGGDIGKISLWHNNGFDCYIQNSVNKITPSDKSFSPYLAYLLYFIGNTGYFWSIVSQISIAHLTKEKLMNTPVVCPPYKEQINIAAYLDSKCSKIDNIISIQEKRIELLKELKQSVITRAVTRGINPDVKMKDSSVEWIGDIPEHWNIVRMRYLCDIITGDKDTINRVDDGLYPFYVRSPKVERINSYSFDGEAVLMAGDGVGAGKVLHYATGKFDFHQRVYNFHNFKKVKGKFLYHYLNCLFKYKIEEGGAKNTVDSVRQPWLKDFYVCLPPIQEQEYVLEYIEKQSLRFDGHIEKAQRQIELLKEYKLSLITEVVTGKRKVI